MTIHLSAADWLSLLAHFLSLSLLAVGGAITTAPDMHRYLVGARHWLSEAQFSSSIALAQAAPGPNVLFVALLGWNLGLNAAAGSGSSHPWVLGLLGMGLAMGGTLAPSAVLTLLATRWAHRHRERRGVRALKAALAPIVVGLVLSTGWLLSAAHDDAARNAGPWLLSAASALLVWRTRVHLLWLIGAGALLGLLGWV